MSVYCIGFFIYYPELVVSRDATYYLLQAKNFSEGVVWAIDTSPLTGSHTQWASKYPVGTSLFLTPFYYLGDLRASFLFPLLSLVLLVLITAKWISENGKSPLFSLLVLGFPATLVLGRVPLSDLPTGVLVVLTCWLFWRGAKGSKAFSFLAGLLWVLISVVREPGTFLLTPLFLGSFFRKDRNLRYIVLGAVIGLILKFSLNKILWNEFFHNTTRGEFGIEFFLTNAAFYSMVLLFLFPAGLIAFIMYRGARWPELLICGAAYFILFSLFKHLTYYDFLKSLVNGPRYFIPFIPILAFQMAEVYPFLRRKIERKINLNNPDKMFSFIKYCWIICVLLASLCVHIFMDQFEKQGATVKNTIYAVTDDRSLIVTEESSTFTYINRLYGNRHLLGINTIRKNSKQRGISTSEIMRELIDRYRDVYIVILERYESEFWLERNKDSRGFLKNIQSMVEPIIDVNIDSNRRLLIYNVYDHK